MHYLDYAATAPVPGEVAEAVARALAEGFGNPSSQYAPGRDAHALLERRRAAVARALGCGPDRLIFTSGGTEGDNWAIRAALWQNRHVGKHIISTAVEHAAVLECLKSLQNQGYSATYLKPGRDGQISPQQVREALRDDTALVCMMLVNNETGIRFPVEDVAASLKGHPALLFCDAVQGFLEVPFSAGKLGADFLTVSGHKIGAPKGIGALCYGGKAKRPLPMIYGGGQENGLRPGTEPTAQIAGFAKAVELRAAHMDAATARLRDIRGYAVERLSRIEGLSFIGQGSAPHILSFSLPGYPSQNVVSDLDGKGIYISAGSACHRGRASHVFSAMGLDPRTAAGALRASFGPGSSREDIDALYDALLSHKTHRFPML